MRALALVVVCVVLLALPSAAAAKFRIAVALGDSRPLVGQPVTVALRTEVALEEDVTMRLVAVAPRADLYAALRDEMDRRTDLRHGFGVPLVRIDGSRWRAIVRFPRAGRWLLVVPNWGAPGYAIPPPVIRPLVVRAS